LKDRDIDNYTKIAIAIEKNKLYDKNNKNENKKDI